MELTSSILPISIQSQFEDTEILFQIQTKHNASFADMQRGLIGLGFLFLGICIMVVYGYFEGFAFQEMRTSMIQAIEEQPEILYSMIIFFLFFLGVPMIPIVIARRKRYHQVRKRYIGTPDALHVVYKEHMESLPWTEISSHILACDTTHGRAITLFKKNQRYEQLAQKIGPQREQLKHRIPELFSNLILSNITKQQEKYVCAYIEGIDEETITQIQKLLITS